MKELHPDATSTTPVGYAVYLKTAADSAGGANWYWYERVPLSGAAPHDANGVVADGMGSAGTSAMQICVGCHGPAGSDAAHTPTAGGRDSRLHARALRSPTATDGRARTSGVCCPR